MMGASLMTITGCIRPMEADAMGQLTMRPSVTYLHLLRHTPFFTALDSTQQQWVINHSKEWQVNQGGVITTTSSAGDYWILLDGEWQLECGEKHYPSKHNDPAKWFRASMVMHDCKLVATETSYVMLITQVDMQTMLNNGFAFHMHLDIGRSHYQQIFPIRSSP